MVTLETLQTVIPRYQDEQTCFPSCKDNWSSKNPALGQCAVTALVIQDYLGGNLLYSKTYKHFRNRLPEEKEVDLTIGQFPGVESIVADKIRARESLFDKDDEVIHRTRERYELLKSRIEKHLVEITKHNYL